MMKFPSTLISLIIAAYSGPLLTYAQSTAPNADPAAITARKTIRPHKPGAAPETSAGSGIVTADGFLAVATGPWQPLSNPIPFFPDTALLLTDGTVMAQDYGTPNWWRLTPDAFGSYLNGTWTQLASMPNGYAPYDYCSAVLADGRAVVLGGEYTYDSNGNATATETNMGAIYDPVANTWAVLNPPAGWTHIGDASCTVLPDGHLMLADNFTPTHGEVALLNPATLDWTILTPSGKADGNGEENWTLLPDGSVLTVDIRAAPGAERFLSPRLHDDDHLLSPWMHDDHPDGEWIGAGDTPVPVALKQGSEMGPQVLRPDGSVFAAGATGYNAVYTPPANRLGTGSWAAAPSFPTVSGEGQLDVCDGVGILLTNGNVLVGASPGCYNIDDYFFELDGTKLNPVTRPSFGPYISSFWARMLMLPTGQSLVTYDNNDVELYNSSGAPDPKWAPRILFSPLLIKPGETYKIWGMQFNGLSQGNNYGDDEAAASNYPIIRITNRSTSHVFYARTHDHSTMGVATGDRIVSTNFEASPNTEPGLSDLVVIANGIPSRPVPVIVYGWPLQSGKP